MKIEFPTSGKYWIEAAVAAHGAGGEVLHERPTPVRAWARAGTVCQAIQIIGGTLIVIGAVHLLLAEEMGWSLSLYVGLLVTWITLRSSRRRGLLYTAQNEFGVDIEKEFSCSYELLDDELRYEDPRQIIEHRWREIVRIVRTPNLLVIVDTMGRIYGIGNHAFSADVTREQFTAELLKFAGRSKTQTVVFPR